MEDIYPEDIPTPTKQNKLVRFSLHKLQNPRQQWICIEGFLKFMESYGPTPQFKFDKEKEQASFHINEAQFRKVSKYLDDPDNNLTEKRDK